MGSVVKHVTNALTGHSGGGSTTQKENSTTNQSQQSWLEQNPQYQQLQNNALGEANSFNMPQYQLAGSNSNLNQSLAGLAQGIDTSGYKNAYTSMLGQGQNAYNQGSDILSGAYNTLNNLGNMSQSDYQNMMKSEYNSDLVNDEINQMKGDVNDTYAHQVESLNQQATGTGNMGNSRAGVTQGRFAEAAQKAIASGSVQYRTAEEQNAYNRLNGYLNLQSSTANNLANIGSSQQQMGLGMYGAGMGYYSQYNQAQTQNLQNQFTAGQFQQQQAQNAIDVARQNQIMAQSPSLQRLAYYNQTFLPMAGLSSTGTGTYTGTSTANTPGQGGNLLGGLMGMGGTALGGMYGGQMGAQMGGMFGGAFGNTYGR